MHLSAPPLRLRPGALVLRERRLLLIELWDRGPHFNLPGGGVEPGESLHQALLRELAEECCLHRARVGDLALLVELWPPRERWSRADGRVPSLMPLFEVHLHPGEEPRQPEEPDPGHVGLRWQPVDELGSVRLHPSLAGPLQQWARGELPVGHLRVEEWG